jgi:hypothetical protein
MGILRPNADEPPVLSPVATVLEHVYQRGALTDENLGEALLHGAVPLCVDTVVPRTFARRSGDKQMRQELVAGTSDPPR